MNTIVIVQSRFGSSRLPGKAMQVIAGRPMLAHVLERALYIRGVERVILATTENPRDDQLVILASTMGVDVYRGDEHDVLSRFRAIVDAYAPRVVVRVTGDCPLLDPRVAERALDDYRTGVPVVALVHTATSPNGDYPDGLDVEVMSVTAVLAADRHARTAADREHVTRWIRRHLPTRALKLGKDLSALKLSVDTVEDLSRVRQLFGYLTPGMTNLEATAQAYRRAMETARV